MLPHSGLRRYPLFAAAGEGGQVIRLTAQRNLHILLLLIAEDPQRHLRVRGQSAAIRLRNWVISFTGWPFTCVTMSP